MQTLTVSPEIAKALEEAGWEKTTYFVYSDNRTLVPARRTAVTDTGIIDAPMAHELVEELGFPAQTKVLGDGKYQALFESLKNGRETFVAEADILANALGELWLKLRAEGLK